MSDDFLRVDLDLLLCRHGYQRVLSALAEAEDISIDALKAKIDALKSRKSARNASKIRKTLLERLENELADRPEKLETIRPLVAAYENGTLLPSLKAVHRFLDSRGVSKPNVKSRKLAGPVVLNALLSMSEGELQTLRHRDDGGASDFSLLSQAIMRRPSL